MVFRRPHLNLGYLPDKPEGVNGLAELIEFNAAHNPDSIFCLQIRAKGAAPCRITFAKLHAAVERCCAWLLASGSTNSRDGGAKSPAPVGILLGSDITIFIYTVALLRLGTPVSTKNQKYAITKLSSRFYVCLHDLLLLLLPIFSRSRPRLPSSLINKFYEFRRRQVS